MTRGYTEQFLLRNGYEVRSERQVTFRDQPFDGKEQDSLLKKHYYYVYNEYSDTTSFILFCYTRLRLNNAS